jgi:hypothetical protein
MLKGLVRKNIAVEKNRGGRKCVGYVIDAGTNI